MKRTLPSEEFFGIIFFAYFAYLKLLLISQKPALVFDFFVKDNSKGVRPIAFEGEISCNFVCPDAKISEKIFVSIKYIERSKKIVVIFKLKSPASFFAALEVLLHTKSTSLLASFLDELAWGLFECFLSVEKPKFSDNYFFCPCVLFSNKFINPYKLLFSPCLDILSDDVLCILYSLFQKRKSKFSYINVSADDILFLRGIKKNSKNYKIEDKKRILRSLEALGAFGLIRFKKLKRFEWMVFIPQAKFDCGFLMPRELFELNFKNKYFEKFLAQIVSYLIYKGKFKLKLKVPVDFILSHNKYIKPYLIREKIENTFDYFVKTGLISSWQYLKINEDELLGANWLVKYKKLKIEFCVN